MTLIGKLDEYILQLENAVNQLRQENQQLQQALQEKSKLHLRESLALTVQTTPRKKHLPKTKRRSVVSRARRYAI